MDLEKYSADKPIPVAGPMQNPSAPTVAVPASACDCHAHLFGPVDRYPYVEGRGYTPSEAPRERYIALLDHLRFSKGIIVQGNAHGYDNRVVLDAVAAHPDRLRGVAITDARVGPEDLAAWSRKGIRGLRFHVHAPQSTPKYVRGVGLDVFDLFRPMLRELGWVAQFWCDYPMLTVLRDKIREMDDGVPIIIDHIMGMPTDLGPTHPAFRLLLELLSEGRVFVKLSGYYRVAQGPEYAGVRPLHDALIAANPDGLLWGSDWPHPQVEADNIPDEGYLVDQFFRWTPNAVVRKKILVDNPHRLFWR